VNTELPLVDCPNSCGILKIKLDFDFYIFEAIIRGVSNEIVKKQHQIALRRVRFGHFLETDV